MARPWTPRSRRLGLCAGGRQDAAGEGAGERGGSIDQWSNTGHCRPAAAAAPMGQQWRAAAAVVQAAAAARRGPASHEGGCARSPQPRSADARRVAVAA